MKEWIKKMRCVCVGGILHKSEREVSLAMCDSMDDSEH